MQHILQGRREEEVLWYQRREFLQGAAAFVAMGGFVTAQAQQRSNVVQMLGDIFLNDRRLVRGETIQTGDTVATGPGSHIIFVVGNASFHVRQNSIMTIGRGNSLTAVSLLRLITGAVVSAWGKGHDRQIATSTLTAGIRGTGVYTEVFPGERRYFCNCYGTVDLNASGDVATSVSRYHQAFWGEPVAKNGRMLSPAKAINHTDEELEYLAALIDQKTAWQIWGKGSKDTGY